MGSFRAITQNIVRLSEAWFCQHNPVLRECAPIDARGRDRYRYRYRDRKVIFEIDTDSDPDTDSDASGTLAYDTVSHSEPNSGKGYMLETESTRMCQGSNRTPRKLSLV